MFPSSKPHQFLFFLCLLSVHSLVRAFYPPYAHCSNITLSADDYRFQNNLNTLLDSLSSNASLYNLYNTTASTGPDILYGQGFCYAYVENSKCQTCMNEASQDIRGRCPNQIKAVVYEERCQLRYSNVSFLGQLDVSENDPRDNAQNVSDSDFPRFASVVNETLWGLTKQAAFNSSANKCAKKAVNFTDVQSIYAFVQCTSDLSPQECLDCLAVAIANTSIASNGSIGARLYSLSCFLRYENYPFYDGATDEQNQTSTFTKSANSSTKKNTAVITGIAIGSAILVAAILGFVVYIVRGGRQVCRGEDQIVEMGDWDPNSPFIDLATLYAATQNFADSNKLGQGGFGPVFKGILPDGREVAVKRLSSCSEQGSDEFTNEVLLILKLQHKNLVRLLGFCVQGEEKLLIYEYMPNGSLDVLLHDRTKRALLSWSRRRNIINGIARGMLYLHEDSRLRIIHRDLKPSNVLLDHHMNPKISDFGMARIFGGSDGEANTAKIVGTYGYMAPEFAMEGLYSVKSDVFSFGVLLIEIITGRRNAGFHLSKLAPSLVAYTWQLWDEGKGLELMDPLLTESCDLDEFLRYMHIGLLCVQEDAYNRPTMSLVVVMLKSETVTLSQPERPAFSVGRFTDHYELTGKDHSVNKLTVSGVMPR
ncbi:Non-specific serine/threonine protein kinase [Bertholletia excelsa]